MMSERRGAEFLQWFGLLGAAIAWAAQFVIGFGVTLPSCGVGRWGIDVDTWQIALMAIAVTLVLLSEAAAIRILLETRTVDHEDAPPWGRRHFFAVAAVLGNILFLVIVLTSGIGAIYSTCGGA